jgi:hypothetical protein
MHARKRIASDTRFGGSPWDDALEKVRTSAAGTSAAGADRDVAGEERSRSIPRHTLRGRYLAPARQLETVTRLTVRCDPEAFGARGRALANAGLAHQ